MSVTMLAFWALVIWAVVSVARSGGGERRDNGEDILAERFARGEIDEEEYRRRRELIQAGR
jgi:putative membrane protein